MHTYSDVTGASWCLTEVTAAECVKLNSASFGVEVRDVHVRLMLGENLRTVPTGRVEKETVSTVHVRMNMTREIPHLWRSASLVEDQRQRFERDLTVSCSRE